MEVPSDLNVDEAGEKCLCWLREAAEMGNQSAQSLCYRFHQTLAGEAAEEYSDKFKDWIIHAAQRGYPAAQEDLSLVANSEEQNQVRQRLRTRYGGTGWNRFAPCYSEDEISIEERDIKLRTFLKRKFDEAKLDPNIDFRINTQGDTPLHFAASAGAITTISLWEETRPIGINTRGGDEETPLLIACRSGHYKIACAIMELEGDPTIANQSGETPLHWLLSFDERYMAEIASRLCAKGADQNAPALGIKFDFAPECNFEAGTPLHRAVGRGNMAAVDALLKVGAKADFDGGREDRYTPLNLAAFLHYPEILDSLLGSLSQARPAAHLFAGMSLLIPAIKGEYLRGEKFSRIARHGNLAWSRTSKTLDVLLEQGATEHLHTFPEGSLGAGCTPLFWATARGDPKVVKYLLDHGCKEDVNTPSRLFPQHTLSTPLHRAITSRRKSTFDVLLEYGANCLILHVNENGYKLTYLYECASAGHADSSMAEKLLSKGVPIDASPKDYETPFACAVRNRCFNLASYLLEHGANSHVEYSQGFMFELEYPSSILGVLIKEQSISTLVCLDYLFAQAEPPNFIVASANGFTVLHAVAKVSERGRDDAACQLTTLRLLEIFKPDKAQINQKTLTGHTAIHFAAIAANVSVAKELVKRGADPTIEDNEGVSAIDWIQMVLGAFDETSDLYVDPADPRPEENQIAGARRRREDILRLFEVYDNEEVG
jgi:ankyrin repeat protein